MLKVGNYINWESDVFVLMQLNTVWAIKNSIPTEGKSGKRGMNTPLF